MIEYKDREGNPISLLNLCRQEPEWAANRISHLTIINDLDLTQEEIKTLLGLVSVRVVTEFLSSSGQQFKVIEDRSGYAEDGPFAMIKGKLILMLGKTLGKHED